MVDCGALPETLLESELFGHVKGASPGALQALESSKKRTVPSSPGCRLLITSPAFQAKLLRVLQEGEIKRVGGTQPIKYRRPRRFPPPNSYPTDLVKTKAFRQDLYYRLAVLPISRLPCVNEEGIFLCRPHSLSPLPVSDTAKTFDR